VQILKKNTIFLLILNSLGDFCEFFGKSEKISEKIRKNKFGPKSQKWST